MIVDGRAIAADILASVKAEVRALGRTPIVRAITIAPTKATESYLKIKSVRATDAGMQLAVVRLENASTEGVIAEIEKEGADAIIVQLPLPAYIDTDAVLNAIPVEKDADILSAAAHARFEAGGLMPPVADAVREILERSNVQVARKHALVIGEGRLVGAPVAAWLWREGANVSVLSKETEEPVDYQAMDIIVSGAGDPKIVTSGMVKEGVVLVDAGTSDVNGSIVGDIDPACAPKASVFTPVPGGVGPIAVACLYRNILALVKELA